MLCRNYNGAPCFGSEFRLINSSTHQPAAESQSPASINDLACRSPLYKFRLTLPSPPHAENGRPIQTSVRSQNAGRIQRAGSYSGAGENSVCTGNSREVGRSNVIVLGTARTRVVHFRVRVRETHVFNRFMLSMKKGGNTKRTVSHTKPIDVRWEVVASIRRYFYMCSGSAPSILVLGYTRRVKSILKGRNLDPCSKWFTPIYMNRSRA